MILTSTDVPRVSGKKDSVSGKDDSVEGSGKKDCVVEESEIDDSDSGKSDSVSE